MFGLSAKKSASVVGSVPRQQDIRDSYKANLFEEGTVNKMESEVGFLRFLTTLSEVNRRDTKDGFAAVVEQLAALNRTQEAILEELRMQRLGVAPVRAA